MTEVVIKDYTQGGIQPYILEAVGAAPGRFLEIGAWAAKDMSNTRALVERGWSGVMIEPSPGPFQGLVREYGNNENVDVVCAAIGIENKLAQFYFSDDALSTTEEGNYERWKSIGGFYGSGYVPMLTLADISGMFGRFDFCSIDTEGTSVAIYQELFRLGMLPRCIVVEHDGQVDACRALAESNGYRVVYENGENLVVAR